MTTFTIVLTGGSPWGFRLQGGREFNEPVKVAKINPNSKAFYEGLQVDDSIVAINGQPINGLNHSDVQALIKNATTGALTLLLQRDTNTQNGHVNGGPRHSKAPSVGGSSLGSTGYGPHRLPPSPHQHRHRQAPAHHHQQHRQTDPNVDYYPPSSSSPFSSSSFSSTSPSSQRRGYPPDLNQWQTGQQHNDFVSPPSGHASKPPPPPVSHKSETPLVPPQQPFQQPPPLPVQVPIPYLRPILPPSHIHNTPYKPYPDQPPPPVHQNPQLSPKLKHQLASPPQGGRPQKQPQRRIILQSQSHTQTQQQTPQRQIQGPTAPPLKHQPMSPPGKAEPVPMKEFMKLLQEDLKAPHPKEDLSIKQQYEEYQLRHQRPAKQQTSQQNEQHHQNQQPSPGQTQQLPSQQHQQRSPQQLHQLQNLRHHQNKTPQGQHYSPQHFPQPHPASYQQPPTHHYTQPLQPLAILSPPLPRHEADPYPFREHQSPSQPRSAIYRPTAISDIFHRGSPTPSLPGDFLRHKQASPTPSEKSTSSEYVLGGGGRGRPNKSRGINLFLKQQERLAAMGADVQDIKLTEGKLQGAPCDFGQQFVKKESTGALDRTRSAPAHSKSLQGSPTQHERSFPPTWPTQPQTSTNHHQPPDQGSKVWAPPARSVSVDAGTRRIPIPVHHAAPSRPIPSSNNVPISSQRARHHSEEDGFPITAGPAPGSSKLSSSWQNSQGSYFPHEQNKGRELGPGSYATLPSKGSRQRTHRELFEPPESKTADYELNNPYSTLPTIKPLKSNITQHSFSDVPEENKQIKASQSYDFGRRDLEHTLDYKDYSKPLWANTDLDNVQQSSISSQDEGHSPHSDNAVSSSDSRDTIIAKDEKSSAESIPLEIPIEMRSQDQPAMKPAVPAKPTGKLIPITVVHEGSSKPTPSFMSPTSSSSLPGNRADNQDPYSTLPSSNKPSQPYRFNDTTNDYRQNGPTPGLGYSQQPNAWEPNSQSLTSKSNQDTADTSLKNIAPIWKPGGSTLPIKKEYRPVRLDTTKKPVAQRQPDQGPPPEESFAWRPPPRTESSSSLPTYTPLDTSSNFHQPQPPPTSSSFSSSRFDQTDSRHMNGDSIGEDSRLPPTQSPYITLLQKSRDSEESTEILGQKYPGKLNVLQEDGQLPRGAQYIGSKQTTEGDKSITETYYTTPAETNTTTTTVVTDVKPVKYDGIGPVDKEGVPLGFRKNVDEEKQRDWYKQMYKSLHKTEKKEDELGINAMIDSMFEEAESNTYKPTYSFPDDISDTKSEEGLDEHPYRSSYGKSRPKADDSGYRSEPEGRFKDLMKYRSKSTTSDTKETRRNPWAPSNARAKLEVYRCQPRSIMDYEPGFSSIAFREQKSTHNPRIDKPGDFSQYSENYKGPNIRAEGDGGEDVLPASEKYKKVVQGGDIPIRGLQKPAPEKTKNFRHQTSDVVRKSLPVDEKEKRRKEEDVAYRKKRLEELYEEDRKKRMQLDAEKESARKHHDFFIPSQKSPISPSRFEEVPDQSRQTLSPPQQRSPNPQTSKLTTTLSVPPERRRGFQIQGKAKALFNFTAQNPRELSFRKGDTLYLLRQIDKNWFEGEHHGQAGIFPVNYVEVMTSIEAARLAAMDAEGQGRARYNFTGQSSVELSLRKGEFVTLLRRVDDNWLEGRVGGRQGIFPVAYVEIIREPSTPLITPAPSVITTPMAGTPEMLSPVSMEAPTPPPQPSPSAFAQRSPGTQAYGYKQPPGLNRFQYDSQSPADLKSPEFTVYGQKGILSPPAARRGFGGTLDRSRPSESISAPPVPNLNFEVSSSAANKPRSNKVADDDLVLQRYRAVYTYRPTSEDELELKEGDEVFVMEKCDDGWFVGTSARTGQFGTFPGNYVQKQ